MEDFVHKTKVLEFWSETGEVLSQHKFSETHLSSSGGSAVASIDSVNGANARSTAPTIHSMVVTKHEFWIMTDDGKEKAVKLNGSDIPLRVGQKITLISAGLKNEQSGYFSVLVNHNSQEHYFITKAAQLNQYLSVEKASGKSILFAILLGLIGFTILPFVIAAFLVMSFCVYRAYTKITSIKQMYKSLDNHLERLAQDTYGRKTETIAPLNDEKANNGRYAIYMKNDHYCAVDTEDFFSFDELNDLLWNGYQYITNVDADSKEQALDIVSKEQK